MSVPLDPARLPVVVGVGQLRSNRERTVEGAREPAALIADAIGLALADTGAADAVRARVQRLDVVNVISWAYDDIVGDIARLVGCDGGVGEHSEVGGNRPVQLLDEAAARIADGTADVQLVAGGEASASFSALMKAQVEPPWSRRPGGPVSMPRSVGGTELAWRHHLVAPTRSYPLYENAIRASLGQTFAEAQAWSGEIYADFTEIAVTNDAAWDPEVRTADQIATPSERNRMICHPYPLLMNAQPGVDQAAAVVVMSLATARALGIDDEHVVHVWGGAGGADSTDVLSRVAYDRAPAMSAVLDATLAASGIGVEDVDVLDLYSCFPCVPKLAALHLGLPRGRRLSVTGGLTAFGGPGNDYSMHALVAATRALRSGGRLALVYGNGELVTKHHAVVLGRDPHLNGYLGLRGPVVAESQGPTLVETASGDATIETYTVSYARTGEPEHAFVIGRLANGDRFLANARPGDGATLRGLIDPDREAVGRAGTVTTADDGRNLFTLA